MTDTEPITTDPTDVKRDLLIGHFEPLVVPTAEQRHVLDLLAQILALPYVEILGELIEDVRANAEQRGRRRLIDETMRRLDAEDGTE